MLLQEELEAVESYIQLEQLRMNGSFRYEIRWHPDLEGKELYIPPMLIQPFVENAIWHGLSQRGEGGELLVTLSFQDDRYLLCCIEDNGREGNVKSAIDLSHQVKKTSLGLALIQERLQRLFDGEKGFVIEDLDPQKVKPGKRVKLSLPFED